MNRENNEKDSKNINKALNQAYKYISFRRRSVWEMKQYLKDKEYDEFTIEQVIAKLFELQLLDDNNYAFLYAEEKVEYTDNPVGPYKLQFELFKRGIDNDTIGEVIDNFYYNVNREKELAEKSLAKKYCHLELRDTKKLRQAANYLERRGFSYEVIRELLFS